jgi:hypothetical protein
MKTVKDWESVYVLAVQWEFESIAEVASNRLSEMTTVFDKIVLGREHTGLEHWLKDALVTICTRSESLTVDEGRMLDKDDLIFIAKFRERYCHNRTFASESRCRDLVTEEIRAALGSP